MAQVLEGSPSGEPDILFPHPTGSAGFSIEQKEYLDGFLRALSSREPVLEAAPESVKESSSLLRTPQQAWLDAGKRLSKEEQIKLQSNPLDCWNTIEELSAQNRLPEDADIFRLKFHGLFNTSPVQNSLMCRTRIPGGALSAVQLSVLADCAEHYGGGFADITTRANFQIREIPPKHMVSLLNDLHEAGIWPRGSGADNIRNITGSPASGKDPCELIEVLPLCRQLHHHILNDRALYGLPRKFNIAFNGGGSISPLEETNDIGFVAVRVKLDAPEMGVTGEASSGVYFRVALGGITGHKDFAGDAGLLVRPEECIPLAVAMVKVFIAHGDRGNRNKARLKYLLDQKGVPWFLNETQNLLSFTLRYFPAESCHFAAPANRLAHLGVHEQKQNGLSWVGVDVPVGRLTVPQMRGLANAAVRFGSGSLRLTVWQNLLIPDVPQKHLHDCLEYLNSLGLSHAPDPVSAGLVACTGSEGCKFGQAPTKGTALAILAHLKEASRAGRLRVDFPVNIHLTGCPHSCAQHFIGDIGLLATTREEDGKILPAFHLFVGGGFQDQARIGTPLLRDVPAEEVPQAIEQLLKFYLDHRFLGQTFSEFTRNCGEPELETLFRLATETTSPVATLPA